MLKLMKYEFRKTMFSKLILLAITAVAEVVFLLGVFLEWGNGLGFGSLGLMLCAVFGILYIGIESLTVFHRELNTKQSYMLFLMPRNSYQILGAKVIENGISIFVTGAFFAVLAALDLTIGGLYIGGVKEFLNVLEQVVHSIRFEINISAEAVIMTFTAALANWIMTIVSGDLAIVLSATVLAGKRFSGFASFALFLLLNGFTGWVLQILPDVSSQYARFGMVIGTSFVLAGAMYAAAGWIMERKLSV